MTTADIKKIIDDERAEQLTARLCRHWEVATARLEALVQDMEDAMDTCIEAEIYAAVMRMQSSVMALMELNKIPTAFLFSEYLDRVAQTVSNASIRQAVMTLAQRLLNGQPSKSQESFFDLMTQMFAKHLELPKEEQEAIAQKVSPLQHIFAVCAQYLNPDDLMMVASIIQTLNTEGNHPEEVTDHLKDMRQAMDGLAVKMGESLQMMLIWLVMLMLLPGLMIRMMQQSRTNSQAMAQLFN